VIAYFGQFLEKCISRPKFQATFFHGKSYALLLINFDKKWVGLHFGRFFSNSSGHPEND
jgi:hypothetical protein